jgi:hypothetical protein
MVVFFDEPGRRKRRLGIGGNHNADLVPAERSVPNKPAVCCQNAWSSFFRIERRNILKNGAVFPVTAAAVLGTSALLGHQFDARQ